MKAPGSSSATARVIENGTIVVDGARIAQAGSAKDVKVPAGAKRVSLTGKTVMPMIIDTHVHLSGKRETLVRDLKQRAYWGVGAAMSMGTDNLELLPMRDEVIPGAARFLSAGRGITRPEPLRPTIFINSEEEGRKAIQENAKLKVDIVKIWVDDRNGKVQKITPEQYAAIIDEAHKLKIRITAHIFAMEDAKGLMRAGLDAFAHGVRDEDVDDEIGRHVQAASEYRPQSEPAGSRREGGSELAAGRACPPRSSPSSRGPTPTIRRRRPSTASRPATWRR